MKIDYAKINIPFRRFGNTLKFKCSIIHCLSYDYQVSENNFDALSTVTGSSNSSLEKGKTISG